LRDTEEAAVRCEPADSSPLKRFGMTRVQTMFIRHRLLPEQDICSSRAYEELLRLHSRQQKPGSVRGDDWISNAADSAALAPAMEEDSAVSIVCIGSFTNETFEHVESAIRREAEIKKWRREKKIALIEKKNPTWEDLAADWGQQVEMTFTPDRHATCDFCHSEPL